MHVSDQFKNYFLALPSIFEQKTITNQVVIWEPFLSL